MIPTIRSCISGSDLLHTLWKLQQQEADDAAAGKLSDRKGITGSIQFCGLCKVLYENLHCGREGKDEWN